LRSNISLKSCGIAIADVHPSSYAIAIADSKKSCAFPPLFKTHEILTPWKSRHIPYQEGRESLRERERERGRESEREGGGREREEKSVFYLYSTEALIFI
jgi:hypothetical protein